jgi:transposase-like protein
MFNKIRTLLDESPVEPLSGNVEVDETYYGGKEANKHESKKLHAGRGTVGKAVVVGAVQRKGRVVARHVDDAKAETLIPFVKTRVLSETMIYTDELPTYNTLPSAGYAHKRVNHSAKVYVDGDAHTNTIDGFWSLVKRGISGTYHSVSAKYLQNYLDEYSFRYNHRDDESPMFQAFLDRV